MFKAGGCHNRNEKTKRKVRTRSNKVGIAKPVPIGPIVNITRNKYWVAVRRVPDSLAVMLVVTA